MSNRFPEELIQIDQAPTKEDFNRLVQSYNELLAHTSLNKRYMDYFAAFMNDLLVKMQVPLQPLMFYQWYDNAELRMVDMEQAAREVLMERQAQQAGITKGGIHLL